MTEPTADAPDDVLLQLAELLGKMQTMQDRLTEHGRALLSIRTENSRQHEMLMDLGDMPQKVSDLDARVRNLAPKPDDDAVASEDYQPRPTVKWWKLSDEEREEAITRLRYWTTKIFLPGYGKLSAMLPACWDKHEFALYTLDWLTELWSVLYLTEERTASTVAAQGEFQTRLLSAACDQLAREATICNGQHHE
jgi:hypothetical protein